MTTRFKNILKGVSGVIATQGHFSITYSGHFNMRAEGAKRSVLSHWMSRSLLVQRNAGLRMFIRMSRRARSVFIGANREEWVAGGGEMFFQGLARYILLVYTETVGGVA
jgi:hypothetical protein